MDVATENAAGVVGDESIHQFQCAGLSDSGTADQEDEFALANLESDVFEDGGLGVGVDQRDIAKGDHDRFLPKRTNQEAKSPLAKKNAGVCEGRNQITAATMIDDTRITLSSTPQ